MNTKIQQEVLDLLCNQNRFTYVSHTSSSNIILEDKYGKYVTRLSNLRKGFYPSVNTAINKTQVILSKFKEVHGELYNYSHVNYIDNKTKVKIICNLHGEFIQSPASHLKRLWMSFL